MLLSKLKLLYFSSILLILLITDLSAQLKEDNNQADYIIITPSQFSETLQPFSDWRQSKNLDVKMVELQQIYSEFPESTPQSSIRDFISHSLTYWEDPKPGYILLVGGANFIPSYMVPSKFADFERHPEDSVSIDEWYSVNLNETDTKPDVAIGRFPISDEQELNNVIQKTIYFEDTQVFEDYFTDFLFLTDIQDSNAFESLANSFINRYMPSNFSDKTIFAAHDSTVEITREHLFTALNDGTLFFSYYGHGAPAKWSRYNIFNYQDIDSLNMNNLPFIFTAAACDQPFDIPNDSSIVRKLIVLPGNGTVASVNSTGLNELYQGSKFLEEFYDNFFSKPDMTIGKAVLQTKIDLEYSDHKVDAITRRYTLLGDPALKLPANTITQIITEHQDIPESYILSQNYPNPFNPSTTIKYSIPKAGLTTLKVYTILGQKVATLVNEEKQAGSYQVKFNGINLASGIYFYQLRVNNFNSVKKLILTK